MKTPFKVSGSTIFGLFIIVIFGLMLTGRSMSEEKSKLGNTAIGLSEAVTYVKDGDFTIHMPKDWNRFFQDTSEGLSYYLKKTEITLLTFPDSEQYAIEITVKKSLDYLGKDNDASLSDLNTSEKETVKSYLDGRFKAPLDTSYSVSSDIIYEEIELNNHEYIKAIYEMKSTANAEYQLCTVYSTVINGNLVIFNCYTIGKNKINYNEGLASLDDLFIPMISSVSDGDLTKSIKTPDEDSLWAKISSFTFDLWVFLVPIVYILICGMKVVDKNYVPTAEEYKTYEFFQPQPLGLTNSKNVLGMCAVLIVFHHLAQTVGAANAGIFNLLENFGVGFVSLFFFFSGYGLLKSFIVKENYLKGFFKNRLSSVLIPFYICVIIFLIHNLATGVTYSAKEFLLYATGLKLINSHAWYIIEIVIFYTAFYFIFRFIKNRCVALTAMLVFVTGFIALSLSLCHGDNWLQGEWWYNTSIIFWLGMLVANCEKSVISFIKKHYTLVLSLLIVLFIVSSKLTEYMLKTHGYWTETIDNPGYKDKLMTLSAQVFMCIVFTFLMITVFLKVRFENKVLSFLGNISLELYLIHNLFLKGFSGIKGVGVYTTLVIIASISAAALIHQIDSILLCKLLKKKRAVQKKQETEKNAWKNELFTKINMNLRFVKKHPDRFFKLIIRNLVCVFFSGLAIFPIYILYINSTKTHQSIVRGISFLPEGHFKDNIAQFKDFAENLNTGLLHSLMLSCFIAGTAAFLAVYFGCACAYGFEVFDFKGKKNLWRIVVMALLFSPIGSFWGFYRLVIKLGLLNTVIPLIIPAIATPSVAYFMRMYFQTVKLKDIVEAARIDGCSEIGIFNRIILPSVKPALSLQMIFMFVSSWNNAFYQGMILQRPEKKTIPMFLKTFVANAGSGSDPVVYAILLMATIPPVVVYILFSKSIVSRIVIGAVKE